MEEYCKVPVNENLTIIWWFKHRHGAGADFEVKAVVPYTKENKTRKKLGIAKITIDGKRNAILHDILVHKENRNLGVGSELLKFIIAYLQDGIAEVIIGNTRGIDDQQIATKFFLKNGFAVDEVNGDFSLVLNKPRYAQFGSLYKGEEAIREKEYMSFV